MTSSKPAPSPGASAATRPYWAARWEDAFNQKVGGFLRRNGYEVRIEPYTSYGTESKVRILARTLLSREATQPAAPHEYMRAVRGWRNFTTAVAPHTAVTVEVGGHTHELVSDRAGLIDQIVDADLTPGWRTATLTPVDNPSARVDVRVNCIGNETRFGIVSDIDDTVMVTALPRPLLAAWNAFVLAEEARRVVPGMPVLYNELTRQHPDAPVFYLSTGAWNVAPALRRFLAAHGFPSGPLLLTDWGPTNTGIFRSGQDHKNANLRDLIDAFPNIKWLLIGDDGQHDPAIYGNLAREYPDHVEVIALRELSPSEHVLSHGALMAESISSGGEQVEVIRAHDGSGLALRLRRLGLLRR
ncbi:App1 family protein [Propionibacteriaceae bacterium Y1685]|uniref:App1 family protein n=1 Tax=Microlunatus sp. Y1700 TaxID=3418487 RepID=UPI003B77FFB5